MRVRILSALALLALTAAAQAQSTAFTYQGRLKNGAALAAGLHDFRFTLFNAASGGAQIGSPQCVDNVAVTDGLFTATLDFGQQFATTEARFLQIEVRADTGLTCASPTGLVTLTPRPTLTAAPYALYAMRCPSDSVSSIAGLRALAIPAPAPGGPATVDVLGYYAPNDLGGGEFFWDATSSELDDGGTVIASNSAPPSGRWKRVLNGPVHAAWWGIPYPGSGADTVGLQAAFNAAAGRGIVFDRPETYSFDPPLVVPDSVTIKNDGRAQFVLHSSILDSAYAVTLGQNVTADHLDISVPSGVVARNLLWLGHGNDIQHIKLWSVNQLNNIAAGSNYDGALQIRSQNVRVGSLEIENIEKGIVLYDAHHVVIEHMNIHGYRCGVHAAASSFIHLKSGEITVPTVPRPGVVAGNNGLLFDTCDDVTVSNMSVHDAGEHAMRIGGAGNSSRFTFNNLQSIRPGGTGFKVFPQAQPVAYRARDIQINGLTVVDAGWSDTGVAPAINENGIQLENCDYVTVNGLQVEARSAAYSAFIGIKVSDAANITFNGPRVTNVRSNGIQIDDDFGYVNSVFINNAVVLVTGDNGILIQSPNQILRDIVIMRCYVRSFPGYGVRMTAPFAVNQPVILDGIVRNDVGVGGFLIQTSNSNVHNLLTVY